MREKNIREKEKTVTTEIQKKKHKRAKENNVVTRNGTPTWLQTTASSNPTLLRSLRAVLCFLFWNFIQGDNLLRMQAYVEVEQEKAHLFGSKSGVCRYSYCRCVKQCGHNSGVMKQNKQNQF